MSSTLSHPYPIPNIRRGVIISRGADFDTTPTRRKQPEHLFSNPEDPVPIFIISRFGSICLREERGISNYEKAIH